MSARTGRSAFLLASALLLGSSGNGRAQSFVRVAEGGFGDCQNTFSWSMAWLRGELFVGTARGSVIGRGENDPELCPIVDDAAEIWSYDPASDAWTRVYVSPRDVAAPAGLLARDNGFRDMIVFEDALYVAGVLFPREGDPRHPRILRSTDGQTFEPVPQDAGTFLGDLEAEGFRAMAVFSGRLYVTAGTSLGEGVLLESGDPASGNDAFRQVSPPGLRIFEIEPFAGRLYAGSGETPGEGFSIWRTDASGAPPYNFFEVVSDGGDASCGALKRLLALCPNTTVLSMEVFEGSLYVGGNTDVLRVDADDSWHVVVGDPRSTPDGLEEPSSGLRSGFGNVFTGHVWRLEAHEGRLYAGTWDSATLLRNVPLIGFFARRQSGFDLWRSADGVSWRRVTKSGLDRPFNHGVRGLVSTPPGLFLGTVNPWEGTEVWLLPSAEP